MQWCSLDQGIGQIYRTIGALGRSGLIALNPFNNRLKRRGPWGMLMD